MNATYNEMLSEIRRAYRVLGKIRGEMQNDFDIDAWEQLGAITPEQAEKLRKYNAECRDSQ